MCCRGCTSLRRRVVLSTSTTRRGIPRSWAETSSVPLSLPIRLGYSSATHPLASLALTGFYWSSSVWCFWREVVLWLSGVRGCVGQRSFAGMVEYGGPSYDFLQSVLNLFDPPAQLNLLPGWATEQSLQRFSSHLAKAPLWYRFTGFCLVGGLELKSESLESEARTWRWLRRQLHRMRARCRSWKLRYLHCRPVAHAESP